MLLVSTLLLFDAFIYIQCPYSPNGAEVQPGSVLLPASRRGRYLANIVRRQAVDGTGIKFNKDADRMNAESKKKVDVLSEELLPYIIAEQERRITLHSRVMSAIQNGEKGITIAEIRNKPPLLIRKGVMYRCPLNRAPKEPDGSGIMLCETDIAPTQIVYDSCLSAEDRDLYVTRSERYFFCNRHKSEGPDLPYNGSTIIGCAPTERTSLNYTRAKCVLEDSDDVVVHYRYYPDRTFKYVTELDPDREVCDHWNPCQIGYLYSIPAIDQAKLANDLWHDQPETPDVEFETDEIVDYLPEETFEEYLNPKLDHYMTSERCIYVPEGSNITDVMLVTDNGKKIKLDKEDIYVRWNTDDGLGLQCSSNNKQLRLLPFLIPIGLKVFIKYIAIELGTRMLARVIAFGIIKLIRLRRSRSTTICQYSSNNLVQLRKGTRATQHVKFEYECDGKGCTLKCIMVRGNDNSPSKLERNRYNVTTTNKGKTYIQINTENMQPHHYGEYFGIIQNKEGEEERLHMATFMGPGRDVDNVIKFERVAVSLEVGGHFDRTLYYSCDGCEPDDVVCNNTSVIAAGRVSIVSSSKMFNFNFPNFEDSQSCVYFAYFNITDKVYKKIIAVIENNSTDVTVKLEPPMPPPAYDTAFEHSIQYNCKECTVTGVTVDGVPIRRLGADENGNYAPAAHYDFTPNQILIHINSYLTMFEGVYQAVFLRGEELITKTIMEIGNQVLSYRQPVFHYRGTSNYNQ